VIAQIKAELLKVRSTRTTLGLVLGMIALILLFTLLTGLISNISALSEVNNQRNLLSLGSIAGIFSALAGALLVTSEFRFGTIRPTFLFTPRRSRVLTAKLVAGLLAGLAFGVIGEGIGFAIDYAILASRGITLVLSGGEIALLVGGTLAATALWAGIGVGFGAIVRNQVGAVIGLLAWGFIVDNVLFGLVPSVGRFMPTRAQEALIGLKTDHVLSPAAGGLVLVAWVAALAIIGLPLLARRDVN
jgi:ABC-2 type transport system permease protein